jgi:phospho-N-acetylmuramoyl-pentapeptide-transferase
MIFMGDTGSLALGGTLAGLAIVTRTRAAPARRAVRDHHADGGDPGRLLHAQLTRKRVFRMAPLQHHFELAGWTETTIVVRFWLIAGMFAALGLWIFYRDGAAGILGF